FTPGDRHPDRGTPSRGHVTMHAIGATLKTSTVILADDHPLVRRGVRSLFQPIPEFSIVAEAKDGFEAVELVERWSPDVLIVDITMPGLDGMEVTRRAAQRSPGTRAVIRSEEHTSELQSPCNLVCR